MFADVELARRIEAAEVRLTTAMAEQTPGAIVRQLGGGVAAFTRPGSPVNKLIGLGFAAPIDVRALAEIEAQWRAHDEPVRVELATLADPETLATLAARGYRLHGFENVLAFDLARGPTPPAPGLAIAIELVTEQTDATWFRVAIDGFATPDGTGAGADEYPRDVLERALADAVRAPGLRRYLAVLHGEPAGAASMRVDAGIVQLCGAATLPQLRRRGVQRALLAARLVDARALGCDLVVVTTEPGSQSQANAQRHGFALLYTRAILLRP